jgi:hypothetical protein
MKEMKLKITGVAPLLMHDNKGANPLSKYAKGMKKLNGVRGKTPEQYEELARLDWESGLYLHHGTVKMPARCIEKCFLMGARKFKKGKQYESGVFLEEDFCELDYAGTKIKVLDNKEFPTPELDKYYEEHNNIQMVKVGTAQIPRCRPIFHDWSFECTLLFDPSIIDDDTLLDACVTAGRLVGLLEQRPRLGRFTVEAL